MKGRVSFDIDDDDEEVTTTILKRDTPNLPRSTPTRKSLVRRVRGVSTSSTAEETWPVEVERTFDKYSSEQQAVLDISEAESEDEAMKSKANEARKIKALRAQDNLFENYISLETTTQKYLDEDDISYIIRQDSGTQKRKMRSKNDTLEEHAQALQSSEDEAPINIDDGLDVETFDDQTGRVNMKLEESTGMEGLSLDKVDFEDEETRLWELQQIRKGFSSGRSVPKEASKVSKMISNDAETRDSEQLIAIPIMSMTSLSSQVNVEAVRLNASIDEAKSKLFQVDSHHEECLKKVEGSEKLLTALKEKVIFFDRLKHHINSLAELADVLLPKVEELENEWVAQLFECRKNSTNIVPHDIVERRDAMMETINGDFVEPTSLLELLLSWKANFGESYEESYVDLCIPSLLEFYLRLQLVGWNPVNSPTVITNFEKCCFGSSSEYIPTEARNKLFKSILIPRLTNLLASAYNPLFGEETTSVVVMIEHLKSSGLVSPNILHTIMGVVTNIVTETTITTHSDAYSLLKSAVLLGKGLERNENFLAIIMAKILEVFPDDSWPVKLGLEKVTTLRDLAQYLSNELDGKSRAL